MILSANSLVLKVKICQKNLLRSFNISIRVSECPFSRGVTSHLPRPPYPMLFCLDPSSCLPTSSLLCALFSCLPLFHSLTLPVSSSHHQGSNLPTCLITSPPTCLSTYYNLPSPHTHGIMYFPVCKFYKQMTLLYKPFFLSHS